METKIRQEMMAALQGTTDHATSFETNSNATKHPLNVYGMQYSARATLAKCLFPMAASAAGGERSFNVYSSTHTKKRYRLGGEKLDSLARIRVNTRQLKRTGMYMVSDARSIETLRYLYGVSIDVSMFDAAAPPPVTLTAGSDGSDTEEESDFYDDNIDE